MSADADQDRFKRLEALKTEAAERLKLPADHDRVVLLAALKLNHETLLARLVGGEARGISAEILSITEAIDKMLPPDLPKSINIKWIGSVVGTYRCKHCNEWNELQEGEYTPAKHDAPAKGITGQINEPGETAAAAFRARRLEAEAKAPKAAETATGATSTTVEKHEPKPTLPPVERPYSETMIKDTRPNAPAANGGGSLCWVSGGGSSSYPLERNDPHPYRRRDR
jgi:hypothetical protein